MKTVTFILIFTILFYSCRKCCCPNKDFPASRQENNSTKLKLDGYYYYKNDSSNKAGIIFLFENGIYKKGYFCDTNSLTSYIDIDKCMLFEDHNLNYGIYIINNDSIDIYTWWYSYFKCPQSILNYKGIILNDSTYQLTFYQQISNKETIYWENLLPPIIYNFKKYSPKPDSVVSFIP